MMVASLPSTAGGSYKAFNIVGGSAPRAHEAGSASDEDVVLPASGLDAGVDFWGEGRKNAIGFDGVKDVHTWDCGETIGEAARELIGGVREPEPCSVFENGSPRR